MIGDKRLTEVTGCQKAKHAHMKWRFLSLYKRAFLGNFYSNLQLTYSAQLQKLLAMSSDALLKEISSVKISVLQPNSHPLYQKMLPKHLIAVLEIPNTLFLLWSDLKSMKSQARHASGTEKHGSKHLNLLKIACKMMKILI